MKCDDYSCVNPGSFKSSLQVFMLEYLDLRPLVTRADHPHEG